MRTRPITLTLLVTLGPALAACESALPFESEPEFVQMDASAEPTLDVQTLDRGERDTSLFGQLSREIPGFGGFWFDRACNLNVVLTDGSQAEKAIELLTPYLRRYLAANPRCPDTATIILHRGEFSWVQLSTWLGQLRPVASLRGVTRMGVSVQANRIVVAVVNRETARAVLEVADRVDVPAAAIAFTLAGGSTGTRR